MSRPDTTSAILWTDGAARGNPGPAGIGAVLRNADGVLLGRWCAPIGTATNNEAEYRALLLGLDEAAALGVRRLEIRADSELMTRQLAGEYRVSSARLRPLYEQARSRMGRFETVRVRHVRREDNSEADALANAGLDSET